MLLVSEWDGSRCCGNDGKGGGNGDGNWWMGSPAQPRPVEPAAPRSPFDFPQGERPPGHLPSGVAAAFTLRRPQGERTPRPRADHSSRGIFANGLPCPTPVTLRQAQGERFPWSCACHSSMALGSTASPASPVWIPAFAGKTMGVCGPSSAGGGGGGPAVAGRAFRERPLRLGWWVRSAGRSAVGDGEAASLPRGGCGPHVHPSISLRANGRPAPPLSPFDRLRANGLLGPAPVTPRWP